MPVYVVIDTMPHGIPGVDIVGVYHEYEEAHAAARSVGVNQCLVRQTTLR